MNEGLRQYGVLVKTLLRNNFYNLLRARRNRVKTSKDRAKSAGLAVAAVFGVLAFVIFEITIAFSLASSAFNSGLYDEVVYVFLTAAQLIVFFFGILTVTGNLYFSKDNAILAPMPFRRSVVFSAKFTVAYLGELFISAVFVVPTTVTVGVVAAASGIAFPWYYYPLCAVAALVAPIVPLLLISFLSVPLMRLAAVFKRHKVGQALAMTVLYGAFIALYFAMIIGLNANDPGESLSGGAVDAIRVIKEIGVLNLPLVALMTGINLTLDGVITALCVSLGVVAFIALTFFVGAFVSFAGEESYSGGARRKRKNKTAYEFASAPYARAPHERHSHARASRRNDGVFPLRVLGRRGIRYFHGGRNQYVGRGYDNLRLFPRLRVFQSRFVDRLFERGEKPSLSENAARFGEGHSLFQTRFRDDSQRDIRYIHGGREIRIILGTT